MIDHGLYKRELHVLGIGNVKLMTAIAVMQCNGLEGKDGEADHSLVAY